MSKESNSIITGFEPSEVSSTSHNENEDIDKKMTRSQK